MELGVKSNEIVNSNKSINFVKDFNESSMELNIRKAAALFFPNPSFEMMYFEAIRNSIDAYASKIEIIISLTSYNAPESIKIEIKDNGEGFTDGRFSKFQKLLETEEDDHKGLGRLVYLHYFDSIFISSFYNTGTAIKKREFTFSDKFIGKNENIDSSIDKLGTCLTFTKYRLQKFHSYDCIKPSTIKKELLLHFYPLFYRLKKEKSKLIIKIAVNTQTSNVEHDFKTDVQEINVNELPDLKEVPLDNNLDLLSELKLCYSVKKIKNSDQKSYPITAICVDERTVNVDIISKAGIPTGYEIIFILYSNFFTGKVDTSRQTLGSSHGLGSTAA